jgi:hypothetical protein
VGANVMTNQTCRECGAYIGESAFCTSCGHQRSGGHSVGTTAAERLGVSYAPPATPTTTVSVAMPTYSESV